MKQGTKIPVQTIVNNTVSVQFVDAVLELDVTPQITADGTIYMDVTVENDQIDQSIPRVEGIPAIDTQSAETKVTVDDGATVVIGGIIVTKQRTDIQQVPLLGSVPVIGNLFKHTTVSSTSSGTAVLPDASDSAELSVNGKSGGGPAASRGGKIGKAEFEPERVRAANESAPALLFRPRCRLRSSSPTCQISSISAAFPAARASARRRSPSHALHRQPLHLPGPAGSLRGARPHRKAGPAECRRRRTARPSGAAPAVAYADRPHDRGSESRRSKRLLGQPVRWASDDNAVEKLRAVKDADEIARACARPRD